MNYFGTFSGEHARLKIQRSTFASFIYKGRQQYSQEEKSCAALATETRAAEKSLLKIFSDSRTSIRPSRSCFRQMITINDYGTLRWSVKEYMSTKAKKRTREIPISEFKAKCLSLVDQVNKTKTPLIITKRGTPVAEVVPVSPEIDRKKWLGSMMGTAKILGDIVSPVIDLDDFEALRD